MNPIAHLDVALWLAAGGFGSAATLAWVDGHRRVPWPLLTAAFTCAVAAVLVYTP